MAQTLHPHNPTSVPLAAGAGVQKMSGSKKRKIPSADFQNSCYFKIRSIVKDLRPTFLEVVHASDFRDCKAASDIRKKMKMIMELYKQLKVESAPPIHTQESTANKENVTNARARAQPTGSILDKQVDPHQINENVKGVEPKRQAEVTHIPEVKGAVAMNTDDHLQEVKGSCVIGGSPIGWNFIAHSGKEAIYYGSTKEAWRAKQVGSS